MPVQPKPIKPQWLNILDQKGGAFKLEWNKEISEQAGCRGLDTELFYPDRDVFTRDEERMFARMCVECPVMLMCLEWGLAHERYGIWGGTTPVMRQRERKRRGWVVNDPNSRLQ